MMNNLIVLLSFLKILTVKTQDNAGTNVAPALFDCYNKTENLVRDNRPATTITEIIELITRIESSASLQNDRELSKEIIHRFKQDGISKQKNVIESKYTIPYSPTDFQADKNRILLKRLIPGNAVLFPNETLTEVQRCSLHFMLSSSIDNTKRDDEATTCKRVAQYVRRIRRDVDPDDEVETFDPVQASPLKSNLEEVDEKDPEEVLRVNSVSRSGDDNLSDCPIENGVVYTKWGAISAGTVLAGIAAGRTPQEITENGRTVNSIYASTLVGDLAEVALQQGSRGKDPLVVGATGGWNGIEIPRALYLEKGEKGTGYEMTNAEIRGGLDGLIIGLNMKDWHSKVPLLKISQVLDMYYSPRGVFSKKYRACNRNKLFTEVAPHEKLTEQAIAYSFMLYEKATLPGTITDAGIEEYSKQATNALFDYTTNKLSDISCAVDDDSIQRTSTDIIIAVDSAWEHAVVQKTLSYLVQNLDVNKFDSTYTVINGKDGDTIINKTYFIEELYTNFTKEKHYLAPKGSDSDKVFDVVENIIKTQMDNDTSTKKAGGPSYILLFLKYDTLTDSDKLKLDARKQNLRTLLPDLKILALGRGSKDAFGELVYHSTYDAFTLNENAISESVKPLLERIKQIPRRLINPNCGSSWSGSVSSSESLDQFVEPYGINFYRVAPNYLYGDTTKVIKIKGYGYGNLVACTSRVNAKPLNATQDNVQCETITTNHEVAFTLEDACKGYSSPLECAPVFFSVQAQVAAVESTIFRCTESSCRFPDNIKYSLVVEGLECHHSGSTCMTQNITLLGAVLIILKLVL